MSPAAAREEDVAVTMTVEQFYSAYEACLKNPPQEGAGRVAVYCQEHNPYSTSSFSANVTAGGTARRGADPVTCAQNPPSSIAVEAVDLEAPDKAVATVLAVFGSSLAQKIPVVVVREKELWRVDAILCPAP